MLHKLLGCFGNAKLDAKNGESPMLTFDFVGLDGGATAAANATPTLSAWKVPVAVTKSNVVDITLGCTYATGVLSGGTVYNSTGLSIDFGNEVSFVPMLTTEQVVLTNRKMTGSLELELSAAQEVAQIASVKAITLQGLGFTLGTATGNKILLHAPSVQLFNPKKVDKNGLRLIGFDLKFMPVAGNDELRIVSL